MKKNFLLIFSLLLAAAGIAQDPPQLKENFVMTPDFVCPYETMSKNWVPKNYTHATWHTYDALAYKLELDWYHNYSSPYNHDYKGILTFTFKVDSTLNTIDLHANDQSITVDSISTPAISFLQSGGILEVTLDTIYQPGDTLSLLIYYTHNNVVDLAFHVNNGFVFTDCSPEKARNWFPCWDRPFDKALFEVKVRTKSGAKLASNGSLMDSITIGDTLIYHWKSRDPIATYIMANLSNMNFNYKEDYWVRPSNPLDTIPVTYYYNPGEIVDSLRYYMTDMMNFFSGLYGEYPFEKLAWATLNSDFPWAGMENQTLISLYTNGWNDKNTTVHEFTHHWFGDLITHATWADIFVKEGFPQYSVCLWFEHLFGRKGYLDKTIQWASYYHNYNTGRAIRIPSWATSTPTPSVLFNYAVTYCKSACVIHTLRGTVGDSAFFAILKSYATDPAFMFKTATADDFRDKVNAITGLDYSWFFSQWLDEPNHPVYNNTYTVSPSGNNWTLAYTINQTQTNAPFFKMPVEIGITFDNNTDTIVKVMNSQNNQSFSFTFANKPRTISFDPNVKILPKVETAPTSCSGIKIFTSETDTIEDGSGDKNYGNNSICMWNINPSNTPNAILLHFLEFDLDDYGDTLHVFNTAVSPMQLITSFTGRNLPADYVCNTSKIRLQFISNRWVTRQGWKLVYSPTQEIGQQSGITHLSIFPNPASTQLNLRAGFEQAGKTTISIYNIMGQEVFTEVTHVEKNLSREIDISQLMPGIYLFEVATPKGKSLQKFIKE